MSWKYKALLHLVLSRLPLRDRVHYFFQRFVTRKLPIPGPTFARRVSLAKKHIDFVQQYYANHPPGEATFYEYGAGWDMVVPLAFCAFGVDRQIAVDIRNMVKPQLVNDTIEKYHETALDLAFLRKPDKYLDGGSPHCLTFHYSHFDKSIPPYNFLQYSDKAWALFNSPLHYQNRLRHRDYLDLLRVAGFEVVEEQCREGTEADLQALAGLPLDKRFGAYSLSDLAIRNALILVRKRDRSSTVVMR